ncbi:hypothetical protein Taro_039193, partial [Colocasia esculenta]|nr:hypothetical protein [Colocasia esculenta]
DAECDSVLCVLLVVVLSRSLWSPFSTARWFVVGFRDFFMAPRRCRERRVVVQTSQQEAGDAPPPPLAQPRPQNTHGGVVPPLPPQATQGFDWTPQLVGGSRAEHWQVLLVAYVPDAVVGYLYAAVTEVDFLQTQVMVGVAQA